LISLKAFSKVGLIISLSVSSEIFLTQSLNKSPFSTLAQPKLFELERASFICLVALVFNWSRVSSGSGGGRGLSGSNYCFICFNSCSIAFNSS
jgi:hypothetical protein